MYREFHHTDLRSRAGTPEVAALLDLYERLAPHGGPVKLEPFTRIANERFGAFTVIAVPAGDEHYRFTKVGAGTAALSQIDFAAEGCFRSLPGELSSLLEALYGRVLAEARPVFAVHRSARASQVHLWERLVLPARDGAGAPSLIDFALPREYQANVLGAVIEASCDGILSLRAIRDAQGAIEDAVVVTVDERAARYLGTTADQLIDQRVRPFLAPLGGWDLWGAAFGKGAIEKFETSCVVEGLDTLLRVTVANVREGIAVSFNDITDLRYALLEMEMSKEEAERARQELMTEISARRMIEGELRRIATTDGLTGVLNRRGFEDRMQKEASTARRYGYPLSVIAIDLDHFKKINDMHGHAAGDMVLMSVAALFMEEIRQDSDTVGRVGGEEFMAVLPHTPLDGAVMVAERLRHKLINLPIVVGDATLYISASFGIAELRESAEATLVAADEALYRAKNSGRNRVVAIREARPEAPRAASGF